MISFGLILYQVFKRIRFVFGNPELRGLAFITGLIIFLGAALYHRVEGWNWLDSIYFTVITLTTIGYGDFAPKTPLGKIFTLLYVFFGLGVLAMFISTVAEQTMEEQRRSRASKDAGADDPQGSQGQETG